MKKLVTPPAAGGAPGSEVKATVNQVSLLSLGRSQAGVPIEALLFSRLPQSKPGTGLRNGRPTVLLIGQQHGDEPASAEALLVVAQELSDGGRLQGVLERINVLVLPRANPDGTANQHPMSANGSDINRDHLLLKTPEARALAKLLRDYQPAVVVDSHEYAVQPRFVERFGAAQRFDAMLQYATPINQPEFITRAAEEWFRRPMLATLKQQGLSADWHHHISAQTDDKKLSMGGIRPDTARNVFGLRNAVSFMIETRGVGFGRLHLKRRVHTQVVMMESVLRSTSERAADLVKLRQYVDAAVQAQACQGTIVVDAELTASEYTLQMLDPATGADKSVVVNWDSALVLNEVKTQARPCGYWLAADQANAVTRLRALGVKVEQFGEAATLQVESRPAGNGNKPAAQQALDVTVGSYFVPLSQPLANLAVAALEPRAPEGYLANGVVTQAERLARVMVVPKVKRSLVP